MIGLTTLSNNTTSIGDIIRHKENVENLVRPILRVHEKRISLEPPFVYAQFFLLENSLRGQINVKVCER